MTALHYATYFDVAPVLTILLHKTKGCHEQDIRLIEIFKSRSLKNEVNFKFIINEQFSAMHG